MPKRKRNTKSHVAREAALINAGMSVCQAAATVVTGNMGFIGEAAHNLGDAASFAAKDRAIHASNEEESRSRSLRLGAAGIFAAGGVFGVSAGSYELMSSSTETASPTAIGIAVACAGLNTIIAKRAHRSVHDTEMDETISLCEHHTHSHSEKDPVARPERYEALLDTKIHALSDAGTGWIYVSGLLAQAKGYGDHWSESAVLVNGGIASLSASFTLRRIQRKS